MASEDNEQESSVDNEQESSEENERNRVKIMNGNGVKIMRRNRVDSNTRMCVPLHSSSTVTSVDAFSSRVLLFNLYSPLFPLHSSLSAVCSANMTTIPYPRSSGVEVLVASLLPGLSATPGRALGLPPTDPDSSTIYTTTVAPCSSPTYV